MTSYQPQRVKRCVILIEMEDGMQHGYQVAGGTVDATIIFNPPEFDPRWWDSIGYRYEGPMTGSISASGYITGLVKMPSDAFQDDQPELSPATLEIGP